MKTKIIAIVLSLSGILAFGQTVAEAKKFTFDAAIQSAISNRPLIEQALASIAATQSQVGEAKSAYVPSLNGVAAWQHIFPKQQEIFGAAIIDVTPSDYWNFQVGASELIYDFGKREFQVRLAQGGLTAARNNLAQIKTNLAYQAAQSFFALLYTKELLVSLEQQKAGLLAHLAAVQAKAQSGSATKYDILNTQIRISKLEGQRIDGERQRKKQALMLTQLVGLPVSTEVDVDGELSAQGLNDSEMDLIDRALSARTEVAQAQNGADMAALSARAAMATWLPSLSASASAGYKNPILTTENTDLGSPLFNWSVGLSLSVPLVNPLFVKNQIEEARKKAEAARENLAAVKENLSFQVAAAYEEYLASKQALENAQEQRRESEQAIDAVKTQFDLGSITNDIYLDSQLSDEQAQFFELTALYHLVSSEYALKKEAGMVIFGARP
jgi:outer membrane protein TolC